MTKDVIELPEIRGNIGDAHCLQVDIPQPELACGRPRVIDLPGRKIDADELRLRVRQRHRDDVSPRRAPQLQHAAARRMGGIEAEERRDGRQAIRPRLRKRADGIGNRVI